MTLFDFAVFLLGFALGIGCTWRYWKHRLQKELFDASKWN